MNLLLAIPIEARLVVVFLLGTCLGTAVNWAVYSLAWNPRPISPWSRPHPSAPRRRWWDSVPVVGWLGLRREAALHGAGFWIRPMAVEILAGLGLVALYWWETVNFGLLLGLPPQFPWLGEPYTHQEFAASALLFALMLAASLIDADEKIIPDEITITGTLMGLFLAAVWPCSVLPVGWIGGIGWCPIPLRLTSPQPWPVALDGFPAAESLMLGLGCWWLWCVGLLPRTWYPRHGWCRAIGLCWVRVARQRSTGRILLMGLAGSATVAIVWYCDGNGYGWWGLLSALVGMAAGGGLIWLVRVIASAALHREAMGFGDVTLMAMIGAFLGWQPCVIIFFLAPLAGVVVGVLRLVFCRDKEIPYGPFLCLAAAFVVVYWSPVWTWAAPIFALGWLVPAAILCCLVLMGMMLGAWRCVLGLIRCYIRPRQ